MNAPNKEKPNPHPYTQALDKGQTPHHLCADSPELAMERVRIFEAYARIARRQVLAFEETKNKKRS